MQRTKLLKIPYVELLGAGLVILLPLANSSDLMQGIQATKSFGLFYGLLAFVGICGTGFPFRNRVAQLKITIIVLLLVAFVVWVSVNKDVLHDVYSLSLEDYETLGLSALLLTIGVYIKTSHLRHAYKAWKDAFDICNYGLYFYCFKNNEKVLPLLLKKDEILINYENELSIAKKHVGAIELLNQAYKCQNNSILYAGLSRILKAHKECDSAKKHYFQDDNMAQVKFYPLFLLSKFYDARIQQQLAIGMDNTILNMTDKLHLKVID